MILLRDSVESIAFSYCSSISEVHKIICEEMYLLNCEERLGYAEKRDESLARSVDDLILEMSSHLTTEVQGFYYPF